MLRCGIQQTNRFWLTTATTIIHPRHHACWRVCWSESRLKVDLEIVTVLQIKNVNKTRHKTHLNYLPFPLWTNQESNLLLTLYTWSKCAASKWVCLCYYKFHRRQHVLSCCSATSESMSALAERLRMWPALYTYSCHLCHSPCLPSFFWRVERLAIWTLRN